MAHQLTCPNAGNAAASDYRGHCPRAILRGPADQSQQADLLPMVELVIQQIAAASISTNGQLGLLALWKRPHRARIGALPA